jgi:hypothetical protein
MTRHALLVVGRFRLLLLTLVGSLAACGAGGSYELRWDIACESGEPEPCPVVTAQDCAAAGFDAVQVVAVAPGGQFTRTLFPCFGAAGPMGEGPGLDSGEYVLEVSALSPGGQLLVGPVAVSATIPGSGLVPVQVTLPRPPACQDGVDNDGDGLVDGLDPGCDSPEGTSEEEQAAI